MFVHAERGESPMDHATTTKFGSAEAVPMLSSTHSSWNPGSDSGDECLNAAKLSKPRVTGQC